jgi:multidrug efflux pump subunit AcrA (membrane-fusion protein)
MTKRLIVFAAFLSLALLVSSCSEQGGQSTPTPVPTPIAIQKPTYQVQNGTVANVLRLQGRVYPVNQQDLFFRSDGYVRTVNFSGGDRVNAGDMVAELELGDLDIQISQAQLPFNRQNNARLNRKCKSTNRAQVQLDN